MQRRGDISIAFPAKSDGQNSLHGLSHVRTNKCQYRRTLDFPKLLPSPPWRSTGRPSLCWLRQANWEEYNKTEQLLSKNIFVFFFFSVMTESVSLDQMWYPHHLFPQWRLDCVKADHSPYDHWLQLHSHGACTVYRSHDLLAACTVISPEFFLFSPLRAATPPLLQSAG